MKAIHANKPISKAVSASVSALIASTSASRREIRRMARIGGENKQNQKLGVEARAEERPSSPKHDRRTDDVANNATRGAVCRRDKHALPERTPALCSMHVPRRLSPRHVAIKQPADDRKIESGDRPYDVHDLHVLGMGCDIERERERGRQIENGRDP